MRLTFAAAIPRSHWLSVAGGTAVAFVFIHILPELSHGQQAVEDSGHPVSDYLEQYIYLIAMAGLLVFYGLERTIGRRYATDGPEQHVFWVHIGAFAIYNAFIGYLLVRRDVPGLLELALFSFAMLLHFMVNDHALRMQHMTAYHDIGRWLLAGAVLAGWGLAFVVELGQAASSMLYAFVAGALVLNVLKEELPRERESRFWAFAAGAVGYAVLLLLVE